MTKELYTIIAIAIMALVTFFLRVLPFLIFSKAKTPPFMEYLGRVLPYSIMAMLVVYCLGDISFISSPFGITELAAVALVAGLHIWKRNTLLSIVSGTVFYMILLAILR